MEDALTQLLLAVDMKPRKRVVDLPNGGTFEFFTTPLTMAERERAQQMPRSQRRYRWRCWCRNAEMRTATPSSTWGRSLR
jgi:hypothetical protein